MRRLGSLLVLLALLAAPAAADYDYDMTAYLSCSSHIDVIWKWLEPESREICYNNFSSITGLMYLYDGERPYYDNPVHFLQSTPVFYEWIEQDHPELMENIRYWYGRGQWHVVGGSYVEFDAQLPSGESLARQFLYGQRYFMEQFGAPAATGFLPDSFGYAATLPMLMNGAGLSGFACSKLNWNDSNRFPFHVFEWIAPDGSSIPTYLSVGEYNEYIDEEILRQRMRTMQDFHPRIDALQLYLGVGDHGGGTFKPWIDRMLALRDESGYEIAFGSVDRFFERLRGEPVDNWWRDELYLETHRGVYTNRADVKQRNREAELGLEAVEKLWIAASDLGAPWPRVALDQIWRTVLFNQFHDVLPGSAIEEYYAGQYATEMNEARAALDELAEWGLQRLAEQVDTSFAAELGAHKVYLVFNPLSFGRDAVLDLTDEPPLLGWQAFAADGTPLPSQWSYETRSLLVLVRDLPPLGWTSVALVDGMQQEFPAIDCTPTALDNGIVSARLDPVSGHLISLRGADGTETIEPGRPANVLQLYMEQDNIYPAWNLEYDKYGTAPQTVDDVQSIEVVESGPVRARLRIRRVFDELSITQDVLLEAGAEHLRLETTIDNWGQVEHRLAKLAFPLNLENAPAAAYYDIPYGTLRRLHDEDPPDNYEAIGQKWVAIQDSAASGPGRGAALLSYNKYGFDIQNDRNGQGLSDGRANVLRLTLLKACQSPKHGDLLGNRGGVIGDRGSFTSIYALQPYQGDWAAARLPLAGWRFNMRPLVAATVARSGSLEPSGSWAVIEPEGVLISALKRPWDGPDSGSVVLRLHEALGRDTTARIELPGRRILAVQPLDLIERPIDEPAALLTDDGVCSVVVKAHSLVTLLIQSEPLGAGADDDADDDSDRGQGCCGCD